MVDGQSSTSHYSNSAYLEQYPIYTVLKLPTNLAYADYLSTQRTSYFVQTAGAHECTLYDADM